MAGGGGTAALHIAPGDSACGSLRHALRDAGRNNEVLSFPDDLSCGPIDPGDPASRAHWWSESFDDRDIQSQLRDFWDRLAVTDDRLIVWFGRHSARELAFFLSLTDRLGERSYDIVDVTGLQLPFHEKNEAVTRSSQAVSIVSTAGLRSLLGRERPITADEREDARRSWRRMKSENAPFRIVTDMGLVSAAADQFDPWILAQSTSEWRRVAVVIGDAMGHNSEPYRQVGDLMLLARVMVLVESGALLADGDVWDSRTCRVRLPD